MSIEYSNWNKSKFENPIKSLNDTLGDRREWTELYADYLRNTLLFGPSADAVKLYRARLEAPFWRLKDQILMKTGQWQNPSLYMYLQFVKFKACGASDEDIKTVYGTITQQEPVLSAEGFLSIQPDTWDSYSAWCPGLSDLDYTCLNIQRLNANTFEVFEQDPITFMGSVISAGGPMMRKKPLYQAWYEEHH